MIIRSFLTFVIFGLVSFTAMGDDFIPVWNVGDLARIESFQSTRKLVGTHYFYWYSYPQSHFFDNAAQTDDALQDHFPVSEAVSYNSATWHAKEIEDCVEAGIDFILPVYWGVVDNYFRNGIFFSVRGLGPLQWAIEQREREGKPSPKIGLFYDTSTLLPGIRGVEGRSEKYDLTTAEGKDIFYRTIRDFFYQIDPKHWACIEGRPIVVFYSSAFAKKHNQSTIDYVYARFQKDFHGVRPYIIKDSSWSFSVDAVTQWGAALGGPNVFDSVVQIGAGYNDSAVPGRSTPIRDREQGDFYRLNWIGALNSDAKIALIETWNEMHEGTDICESKEYGRLYIELTKEYGARFKRNEKTDETIVLKHPDLLPRPASNEGVEYKDVASVRITLGDPIQSEGIKLTRGQPDGPVKTASFDGVPCIVTVEAANSYMYFSVVDPFYFDDELSLTLTYTYWDNGFDWHAPQYDSHDRNATLNGAYKTAPQVLCGHTKRWIDSTVNLRDARFVNRQNGASDFRFAVSNGSLAIKEITISKDSSIE